MRRTFVLLANPIFTCQRGLEAEMSILETVKPVSTSDWNHGTEASPKFKLHIIVRESCPDVMQSKIMFHEQIDS
ncbi:hypothetical protein Pfo_004226 [Paulownia fortunei]|nr:hypothetical protein Pfo_004226 [Paulownia fortunei]